MIKIRFLFCICMFFFSLQGHAVVTDRQYYFRSLDINDGLSQNTVHDIIQDRTGFLWFATANGLNRYDGLSFQVFMKENGGLGNNFVTALYEDNQGQIWIGTDGGVYIYSPETESTRFFDKVSDLKTSINRTISLIEGDEAGNIWISANSQGLFCYSPKADALKEIRIEEYKDRILHASSILFMPDGTSYISFFGGNLFYSKDKFKTMLPFMDADGQYPFAGLTIHHIVCGAYNRLYLGTNKGGLKEINLATNVVQSLLSKDENGENLFVREIALHSDDELWMGTESGVYIYDVRTGQFIHLQKRIGDAYSLNDNAIYSILKDREGAMWIGSYFGGINYYPKQYTYFEKFYPIDNADDEIGERVREICEDKSGNLWIGTEDKGLFYYNPTTRVLKPYRHPAIHHNIHGLCLDKDYLWVGMHSRGLSRINLRDHTVKTYLKEDGLSPHFLKADHVFTICLTSSGQLYLGTPSGLIRYNHSTDDFTRIPELKSVFIYNLLEDTDGNLWAASYSKGLYRLDIRSGKWHNYRHDEKDVQSLPHDKLLSVFEDSHKQIWVTTQGRGFCRYNPLTKGFITYDSTDGLPGNVVSKIVEDNHGLFWITTNKGLVRFDPKTAAVKVYTKANGLLTNQFNYQSAHKDKNGTIYLGSIKGLVSFNPKTFTDNTFVPSVVITDFMVFNKKVQVGAKGSPLKESITTAQEISLPADQNSFSLRIAALSYQAPEMNKLVYKLEGFDKDWYEVELHNLISYSNLPYGSYMLMIKGSNSDGVWNNDMRKLKIHILPPFYLTAWAYLFYFLVAMGIAAYSILYFRKRSQNKHRVQMEKFEQEKEREFYTAKIDFFTNVAHEIRTPLTLIKSPLENLLRKKTFETEVKTDLEIMDQNTERLLNLTNQLLDFRKAESSGFKLNLTEIDIIALVKHIFIRFTSHAKQKGVEFKLSVPDENFTSLVDREALIKIISNLLTNALKYTETYVHASLSLEEDSFCFKICNDGSVIPLKNREEIFEPFVRYREGRNVATGTGIGLALARSLSEQHEGTLRMDNSQDKNCFLLLIPVKHQSDISNEQSDVDIVHQEGASEIEPLEKQMPLIMSDKERVRKPAILVVEDNPDMLAFISRQFSENYQLLTATNGLEGLKVMESENVNLVVSDVMMPEMDGLEFCDKIKSDLNFSHIPVILLTAKTSVQSKIEGLRTGADAYIEKPFSVEHLEATISSLLSNREKMRQAFVNSPFISFNTMAMTKADELFIKALDEVMQANIAESEFSVDDMASALNMSRSSLNRKIRGVLDMSPNDYIRIERLKKAASLLKEKICKVNEVCYMVGFNTPSYFAKCFQKQFGVLPKDFD